MVSALLSHEYDNFRIIANTNTITADATADTTATAAIELNLIFFLPHLIMKQCNDVKEG